MNKADLIKMIAKQSRLTKTKVSQREVSAVLDLLVDTIARSLRHNENVTISNFGRFEVRHHKATKKRSPHTHELYDVAAKRSCGFVPSKVWKRLVQDG